MSSETKGRKVIAMKKDTTIIDVTDINFKKEVVENQGLVLLNFWAEWSGACHIMTPVIEEMSVLFQEKVKIAKLDVDRDTEVPKKYGICSTPTILFFKGGEAVEQITGTVSRKEMPEKLECPHKIKGRKEC